MSIGAWDSSASLRLNFLFDGVKRLAWPNWVKSCLVLLSQLQFVEPICGNDLLGHANLHPCGAPRLTWPNWIEDLLSPCNVSRSLEPEPCWDKDLSHVPVHMVWLSWRLARSMHWFVVLLSQMLVCPVCIVDLLSLVEFNCGSGLGLSQMYTWPCSLSTGQLPSWVWAWSLSGWCKALAEAGPKLNWSYFGWEEVGVSIR